MTKLDILQTGALASIKNSVAFHHSFYLEHQLKKN
jgi:hypothetical protein